MSIALTSMPFLLFTADNRREKHRPDLLSDSRGAVLMVGLFMACFLIGSLWFLIGVGEAVVYRDKAQEVADVAVFASATVHARGMNMIAAINLIMLMMVSLYLICCIVVYIMQLIHIALASVCTIACIASYGTGCGCFKAVKKFKEATNKVEKVRDAVKAINKTALPVLSKTQTVIAVLMPHLGQVSNLKMAANYDHLGLSMSPSMIPGVGLSSILSGSSSSDGSPILNFAKNFLGSKSPVNVGGKNQANTTNQGNRLGLPVVHNKMNKLCDVAAYKISDAAGGALNKVSAVGEAQENDSDGTVSSVMSTLGGGFGNKLTSMFCNEQGQSKANWYATMNPISWPPWIKKQGNDSSFWKSNGPKGMYNPAKNGSDWESVWSVVPGKFDADDVPQHIAMGGYEFNHNPKAVNNLVYFAQAEFYYDCDNKWNETVCNGEPGTYDRAIYGVKWKARLKRYRAPSISGMLTDFFSELLMGNKTFQNFLRNKLRNVKFLQDLEKQTTELGKNIPFGQAGAETIFDWLRGKGGKNNKRDIIDWAGTYARKIRGFSGGAITGEVLH